MGGRPRVSGCPSLRPPAPSETMPTASLPISLVPFPAHCIPSRSLLPSHTSPHTPLHAAPLTYLPSLCPPFAVPLPSLCPPFATGGDSNAAIATATRMKAAGFKIAVCTQRLRPWAGLTHSTQYSSILPWMRLPLAPVAAPCFPPPCALALCSRLMLSPPE